MVSRVLCIVRSFDMCQLRNLAYILVRVFFFFGDLQLSEARVMWKKINVDKEDVITCSRNFADSKG